MAYEQKPDTGSLFRNEKMREGKKDAEYTGSALIDGVEYWVNAWVNEVKSGANAGKKYFNMQYKPKEERQQSGGSSSQQSAPIESDDIPF